MLAGIAVVGILAGLLALFSALGLGFGLVIASLGYVAGGICGVLFCVALDASGNNRGRL
jgi:hypothetical protein